MSAPTNLAARALSRPSLTEWQRSFLSVVATQRQPLTPTQAYWVSRLLRELGESA